MQKVFGNFVVFSEFTLCDETHGDSIQPKFQKGDKGYIIFFFVFF